MQSPHKSKLPHRRHNVNQTFLRMYIESASPDEFNVTLLQKWRTKITRAEQGRRTGTQSQAMHQEWEGELVVARLEAAFRSKPDAAMYSLQTENDLSAEGPAMEGCRLIPATAVALGLDSPARIHLLCHARARRYGRAYSHGPSASPKKSAAGFGHGPDRASPRPPADTEKKCAWFGARRGAIGSP
jgi:hypothetical protein